MGDELKYYEPKYIQNTSDHIVKYGQLVKDAAAYRRKIEVNNTCKYGIKILDEYLGGILDNELVVIAAETGMGKSEVAYMCAIANAKRGKKVLLLGLEGDIFEVAFRHLQREFKKVREIDPTFKMSTIQYRFNLDPNIADYEDSLIDDMEESIKENLFIFNKKEIPKIEFLKELIILMAPQVDMIVLDHLHYIDLDGGNENQALGEVVRELKRLTDIVRKPIVLVSHVRKIEQNKDGTMRDPTRRDLFGTSNIAKEATTIILLAPMKKYYFNEWGQYVDDVRYTGTKFICDKSRIGLPVPSKFGMIYDLQQKDFIVDSMALIEEESAVYKDDRIPVDGEIFSGGLMTKKEIIKPKKDKKQEESLVDNADDLPF